MSEFKSITRAGGADDARDLGSLSQWQLIRLRFAQHRLAKAALYMLTVLYLVAAFAEFIAPYPQEWRRLDHAYNPPQPIHFSWKHGLHGEAMTRQIDPVTYKKYYLRKRDAIIPLGFFVRGEPYKLWGVIPMRTHLIGVDHDAFYPHPDTEIDPVFYLLGADKYGHDLFSRIIYGSRISLTIGLVSIVFTFLLGVTIGGISGYLSGRVDNLIQRSIEIINALPELPLWLALSAVLPADWPPLWIYFAITILLSALNWTGLARVVRGKILSLREEDYAVAARLTGANHFRILFRHLVPGFTSHIIVALTLSVPGMILGETALSFLGLGLRPPVVSWGVLLQDTINFQVVADYPWLLMPVFMIVLTVLSFNFFGDGMRDAADPYSVH